MCLRYFRGGCSTAFFFAELTKVASYAIMLCAALIDQARLFDQVRSHGGQRSAHGPRELSPPDRGDRVGTGPFPPHASSVQHRVAGHGWPETINDRYGHLVGSRALVRLGKILRNHSRAIDTAARYGGDEFALVLPEAPKDIASRVAARVRERLATETEEPALSVSAGIAAYPKMAIPRKSFLAQPTARFIA